MNKIKKFRTHEKIVITEQSLSSLVTLIATNSKSKSPSSEVRKKRKDSNVPIGVTVEIVDGETFFGFVTQIVNKAEKRETQKCLTSHYDYRFLKWLCCFFAIQVPLLLICQGFGVFKSQLDTPTISAVLTVLISPTISLILQKKT